MKGCPSVLFILPPSSFILSARTLTPALSRRTGRGSRRRYIRPNLCAHRPDLPLCVQPNHAVGYGGMTHVILTAIGTDRPGLVDEVSRYIFDRGGNIEDSRMVNFRGQFAMMVLVGGGDPV